MPIPFKSARHLRNLLFNQTHPACILTSSDFTVIDWYGALEYYGINQLEKGMPVFDQLDFMVGLDVDTRIDYPAIEMPGGKLASVSCVPSKDRLAILIFDVTDHYHRNQELQQKANEVQLLNEQLHNVMLQLASAQRQLTEKNELLVREYSLQGKFLASVSHEFRTPLTSILGYSELFSQYEVTDDQQKQYAAAITRGAKHLLSMIENVLDNGRLAHDEVVIQTQPTVISDLVADIEALFIPLADVNKLNFSVFLSDYVPDSVIDVDQTRVRQCLINLVGNAVKYTEVGTVELKVDYQNGFLEFLVIDTGPGIATDNQENIFDAFKRVPGSEVVGAGLGLNISKQLVELMGGDMIFSSELGYGTTIGFTLPAMVASYAIEKNVISSDQPVESTPMKVLIAEDDGDISVLLETILSSQGYTVFTASNGVEAIKVTKDNDPGLILMDINMPELDGLAATQKLRDAGYQQVILAMTASSLESDIKKALASGCDDCLLKPIDRQHLNQVVARYATQH